MKWHKLLLFIFLFVFSAGVQAQQKKSDKKSTVARLETAKDHRRVTPKEIDNVDPKSIRLYKIDSVGWVYNLRGMEIGRLTARGMVYDGDGRRMGNIVQGTQIRDSNLKLLGRVNEDGIVTDLMGNVVGTILPDGTVKDNEGNTLAVLEGNLKSQAAAFLFFFR